MLNSVHTVTRPDDKFRHPDLDDADQTLYGTKNVGWRIPNHRKISGIVKNSTIVQLFPMWLIQDFKYILNVLIC